MLPSSFLSHSKWWDISDCGLWKCKSITRLHSDPGHCKHCGLVLNWHWHWHRPPPQKDPQWQDWALWPASSHRWHRMDEWIVYQLRSAKQDKGQFLLCRPPTQALQKTLRNVVNTFLIYSYSHRCKIPLVLAFPFKYWFHIKKELVSSKWNNRWWNMCVFIQVICLFSHRYSCTTEIHRALRNV